MSIQASSLMVVELECEPCLLEEQALLREMAVWLADAVPEYEHAQRRTQPRAYTRKDLKLSLSLVVIARHRKCLFLPS